MYNLQLETRQRMREEMGDTYDPICLLDIESDDECVTEKEEPRLPINASWMYINECFTFEERPPNMKIDVFV